LAAYLRNPTCYYLSFVFPATLIYLLSLFDTMLNFVENLLENERDPRSGPMNHQDHSLFLSDPDRSLALSHFLQNLASCHTAFTL
jgi:hypothetical protein